MEEENQEEDGDTVELPENIDSCQKRIRNLETRILMKDQQVNEMNQMRNAAVEDNASLKERLTRLESEYVERNLAGQPTVTVPYQRLYFFSDRCCILAERKSCLRTDIKQSLRRTTWRSKCRICKIKLPIW